MAVNKAGNLISITSTGDAGLTDIKIAHIFVDANAGASVVEIEATNGGGVVFSASVSGNTTQHFPLHPAGIVLPSVYVKTLTNAVLHFVTGG